MSLSRELGCGFVEKIYLYQVKTKMPFIAPFEEIVMEKGLKQGLKQGLELGLKQGNIEEAQASLFDILEAKFGRPSTDIRAAIVDITDIEQLRMLRKQALFSTSIMEIEPLLRKQN